jgi:hypothetical protein
MPINEAFYDLRAPQSWFLQDHVFAAVVANKRSASQEE